MCTSHNDTEYPVASCSLSFSLPPFLMSANLWAWFERNGKHGFEWMSRSFVPCSVSAGTVELLLLTHPNFFLVISIRVLLTLGRHRLNGRSGAWTRLRAAKQDFTTPKLGRISFGWAWLTTNELQDKRGQPWKSPLRYKMSQPHLRTYTRTHRKRVFGTSTNRLLSFECRQINQFFSIWESSSIDHGSLNHCSRFISSL